MHRALAALVAALSAVPAALGQSPPVTEAELFAAAGEDHPALAALREEVGAARAAALAAASLADPVLGVEREDPGGAAEQVDLTLAWQPPGPDRGLRRDAAEHGIAAAEARLRAERLAVHVGLHQVFADWALAQARADRLTEHARGLADLARRERARADRGESSGLEARRLELAASEARSRVALAEADLAAARGAVAAWIPALGDDARPELPALPPVPDALPERPPRVEALAEELAAARLSRRAASRIVGWPELTAGWQRQDFDAGSAEGPILGFSWPLPLLDRNRAERSLTTAREQAAEARYEAAVIRLDAERDGALAAYRRLEAGAGEAREATAGNAAMLAGALAAFEHGEASVTDLLETLRSALDAEGSALDVHAAALAAFRRLEEAAGIPLDAGGPLHAQTEIQPTHGGSP